MSVQENEESARLLDKAAVICVTKHAGQRDKAGRAYFQHPMRVALRCRTDEEKMVALLHDVIEDTDVTPDYLLSEGFPQSVVDGVLSVTKRDGEAYEDFVARAKQNPLGRAVKIHDLEDNLDVFRLDSFSPDMSARFSKYLAAYHYLLSDQEPDKKEMKTISDLYTEDRESANRFIRLRAKNHGGTNRMQNRLVIRDKDSTVINETSIFNTLAALGREIGFDKIWDAGVTASKGGSNYSLISRNAKSKVYKSDNSGWMILSNAPVTSVALALNELFEKLNLYLIATVVDR